MELKVRVLSIWDVTSRKNPTEVTYMNMFFVDENVLQCYLYIFLIGLYFYVYFLLFANIFFLSFCVNV
jgi:hypothetical protein